MVIMKSGESGVDPDSVAGRACVLGCSYAVRISCASG